jgi:hypothetical protein
MANTFWDVVDGNGNKRAGPYDSKAIALGAVAMLKMDRKPDAHTLHVVERDRDSWDLIEEANTLRGKLDQTPLLYIGDRDVREGGIAVTVDRRFGYATVVEMTDLGSAAGASGALLLRTGSVVLDSALRLNGRRHLRSAMETMGMTMASLRERHPDDRWKRMAEIGYATWNYGFRDIDSTAVLIVDREAFDEANESGRYEGWAESGEDCADPVEAFMERVYSA